MENNNPAVSRLFCELTDTLSAFFRNTNEELRLRLREARAFLFSPHEARGLSQVPRALRLIEDDKIVLIENARFRILFVHAAEASHGDLGMITADDVILALSWSGEQPEMKNLISYAARFRIAVIAMTSERESSLSKAADVALTLPKAREACPHNLAPTTSSLMMLALGDALAIALLEGRGFTSIDFSVLHPGGKLGALLKYTRDLMHSGDAVPLKPLGTKMSEALVEMTSKGFGCVGIVDARGHLAGIVTDGDLRRHMGPDLMAATVDEVMTKNPKTIDRDVLAGEALEILNSSKITTLIVTDAGKPVGIVHLHDFLRAGVA
jgi:arabinose-5-phosphate isomerase